MHSILNPDLERQAVPFEDTEVKTLHPTGDNACDLLIDQFAQRIDIQLRTNDGQARLGERRQLRERQTSAFLPRTRRARRRR